AGGGGRRRGWRPPRSGAASSWRDPVREEVLVLHGGTPQDTQREHGREGALLVRLHRQRFDAAEVVPRRRAEVLLEDGARSEEEVDVPRPLVALAKHLEQAAGAGGRGDPPHPAGRTRGVAS